jgi:Ca-activated chloride channel family protein
VSRYTSLVAVDKTPARPAGYPLAGGRVPNLAAHGQAAAFPATATNAPLLRLGGMLTLLLAGAVMAGPAFRRRLRHGRAA